MFQLVNVVLVPERDGQLIYLFLVTIDYSVDRIFLSTTVGCNLGADHKHSLQMK